ncbi:MAG: hypothetical protein ACI9J2_001942 [Saprospiraceae bacterium]|jgi:hypothetical protein
MDLLNSPLSVILFILGLAGIIWYKERTGIVNKCDYCDEGKMLEVSAELLGPVDGGMHQDASLTKVLTKIRYECTHCDEFWEKTITR